MFSKYRVKSTRAVGNKSMFMMNNIVIIVVEIILKVVSGVIGDYVVVKNVFVVVKDVMKMVFDVLLVEYIRRSKRVSSIFVFVVFWWNVLKYMKILLVLMLR